MGGKVGRQNKKTELEAYLGDQDLESLVGLSALDLALSEKPPVGQLRDDLLDELTEWVLSDE